MAYRSCRSLLLSSRPSNILAVSGRSYIATHAAPAQWSSTRGYAHQYSHTVSRSSSGSLCYISWRTYCSEPTSDATEPWRDVSHSDLKQMLSAGNIFLIDVRERHELQETGKIDDRAVHIPLGTVPDAFNLSPRQFEQRYGVSKPDENDTNVIFHCRAGIRSRQALRDAHACGYTQARHYLGGWLEWESHQVPK
ncbi:rhodanese domain-containing protein CG4456-like [Sycon ciliatum]|uniref:rhodanese domain-containing protein CG4456-like n=1 Tax=Sycon ciliatum TaxID=27933 RepID=UPI0020AACE6A|eukprot:scpid83836/ scgid29573/ Heat shock protein 67B2